MRLALAAAFFALAIGACAHVPPGGPLANAPVADSATIVLLHLDETNPERIADSGGYRLDGVAGQETGTEFGRHGNARVFTESVESFVHVPYSPSLESPRALTIEAWVHIDEYGRYEDTPIAGRWTELSTEQSWLLSIVGGKFDSPVGELRNPGFHRSLVQLGNTGQLMFALQPEGPELPLSFFSNFAVERDRWTHVAVTFDGELVRIYLDGRLDAQYAARARIRSSHAPILIGNYFDPRWLTDFGGTLRVGAAVDRNPYYAFRGMIDELRVSSVARAEYSAER